MTKVQCLKPWRDVFLVNITWNYIQVEIMKRAVCYAGEAFVCVICWLPTERTHIDKKSNFHDAKIFLRMKQAFIYQGYVLTPSHIW